VTTPKLCPICGTSTLHLYEDDGDCDEADEPFWAPGEECGVVLDEDKTGCFDWQMTVVGWQCANDHVFFVVRSSQDWLDQSP
jgi:hypothetical protein